MFGFVTDAIEDGLDVVGGLLEGELPSKRQVASLVNAGMSIYAISEVTGIASDVLENMLDD